MGLRLGFGDSILELRGAIEARGLVFRFGAMLQHQGPEGMHEDFEQIVEITTQDCIDSAVWVVMENQIQNQTGLEWKLGLCGSL